MWGTRALSWEYRIRGAIANEKKERLKDYASDSATAAIREQGEARCIAKVNSMLERKQRRADVLQKRVAEELQRRAARVQRGQMLR